MSMVISNMTASPERFHLAFFCKFFEGIWNNYVDIQHKNMQMKFIMILQARGYNYLSHPTLHYEIWSTNVSKYELVNPIS